MSDLTCRVPRELSCGACLPLRLADVPKMCGSITASVQYEWGHDKQTALRQAEP